MEIVLFKEITTEEKLSELEAQGKKYEGLYVDMDNAEERKYVKDGAQAINGMLKSLDRARIDKAKEYKRSVEAEAKSIRERLEEANKPFTLLIDEHKEKRAKILAEKKAKEEAEALKIQIEYDHGIALMENKIWDSEEKEREEARKAEQDRIAKKAAEHAVIQEQARQKQEAERAEAERLKRESDQQHVSNIRRSAKEALIGLGLNEEIAKAVVIAIHKGDIPNVSIKY